MTNLTDPPPVGDKVVYCGNQTNWGWPRRRTDPGIVVEVDVDERTSVRVWSPSEGEWWGGYVENVRVVERATYTPVAGPS